MKKNDRERLNELLTEYLDEESNLDLDSIIEMDTLIEEMTAVAEHGGCGENPPTSNRANGI